MSTTLATLPTRTPAKETTITLLTRAATVAATALLLSGCATSGIDVTAFHIAYEEPTLFSCGYLRGDTAQDVCHVSLYRVHPTERSEQMVGEIAGATQLENP